VEVEIPVSDAVYAKWRESVLINTADYPWGYAWVIPRYPVLNIGVGSFHANRLRLQPLLREWVAAKLGPDAGRGHAMLAHPLPYRYQPARLAKERALLVGDAAGLMDALSAEGIYSALYSASLAAQTVIAQSPHDASLEIYDHRLQRELWPGLKAAAKLALMFYPLPGMWSKIFLANPNLIEQYLKVAQGQAPYSSLLVQGQRTLLRRLRLSPSSLEGIGD
jgi:flavin-dependent dehydrogenase